MTILLFGLILYIYYINVKKIDSKTDHTIIQSFTNQGNSYTLNLDSYVTFKETTKSSDVNNVDGLEVNYMNNHITIQRFPSDAFQNDFQSFLTFIKQNTNMGNIEMQDTNLTIENNAVQDSEISYLYISSGSSEFTGYLVYMKTDNGMYKLLISGGNKNVVEHYKTYINDMEFK